MTICMTIYNIINRNIAINKDKMLLQIKRKLVKVSMILTVEAEVLSKTLGDHHLKTTLSKVADSPGVFIQIT